jgi:hypothetical protein
VYSFFKYAAIILGLAVPLIGAEEESSGSPFVPDEVSFRFGFSATNVDYRFREYRVGTDWNFTLPETWTGNWLVVPQIDLSAGCLTSKGGHAAFVTSVGPALTIGYKDFPIVLEASCCPTFISLHDFGGIDMGSSFQFTSNIGLRWYITPDFGIGYRFQHMSNGGVTDINPGMELHVVSVSWRF